MAYIDQAKKAGIAAELKKCMPKDWKYSLAIRHHAEIVMTIMAAPADIIGELNAVAKAAAERRGQPFHAIQNGHVQLGHVTNHITAQFPANSEIRPVLENALMALKSAGWYDNSDPQVDHFDTAYHYSINIGRWDKPFHSTSAPS
ncbi:hypothetical protein C1I89_06005 [Achromobacter pulmonis]|uniref:Uncharacterized protein n=1 Tax=Achromobacter pulmonis TaxID=1389932 RepID=A0A2N8KK38_9BURK|nr:hypothetical protein [Achromobacter pulmonis]PND33817.1 hypothetical protein C1I89_06005 [Achromobacter pulmonis]